MHRRRRAFTLVELLVVVFILAALAASASSMVDGAVDRARDDDNAVRLSLLRRAVVGSDDPSAAISGYVADVGALPTSIRDLLRRPPGVAAYSTSHLSEPGLTGVGSGWRGPYLRGSRRADDVVEFLDGWGNADDPTPPIPDELAGDPNFGWLWTTTDLGLSTETLEITSVGANGLDDPLAAPVDDVAELLQRVDHHVDLAGHTIEVTVRSTTPMPAVKLALRAWRPQAGSVIVAAESLASADLSLDSTAQVVALSFPATPTWVPHGVRALELCTASGTSSTPFTPRQYVLVDLRARAALPVRLTRPFNLP